MIRSLFGVVEFSHEILCAKDSLGATLPISIGNHPGTLEMPRFPAEIIQGKMLSESPLLAPSAAIGWKHGAQPIYWGQPIAMPSGMSEVARALLRFDMPETEIEERSVELKQMFNGWRDSLEDYIEAYTKQRLDRFVDVEGSANGLELLWIDDDGKFARPDRVSRAFINVIVAAGDISLHVDTLGVIAKLISEGEAVPLEYRIQLEAYKAMRSKDYRKAIVETASAAEIALTEAIKDKLRNAGLTFAEGLLGRFRTLGGRLELARILQVDLPDVDIKSLLVSPRNHVTHGAYFADRGIARKAIRVTDSILERLRPLPTS